MDTAIRRFIQSDGAARPVSVPYREDEIAADIQSHRQLVAYFLRRLADGLRAAADVHDTTALEDIDIVTHDINEARTGASMDTWLGTMHADDEQHHWDARMPDRPTLQLLLEYLADRTAYSLQMHGRLPDYADLPEGLLSLCLRNTEDDLSTFAGVER